MFTSIREATFVPTTISRFGCDVSPAALSNATESYLISLPGVHVRGAPLRRYHADIPEISFFLERAPDREPGDLVAGFLDGALDLLLFSPPSFE